MTTNQNLIPEESGVLNIDTDNIHFSEANFRITSPQNENVPFFNQLDRKYIETGQNGARPKTGTNQPRMPPEDNLSIPAHGHQDTGKNLTSNVTSPVQKLPGKAYRQNRLFSSDGQRSFVNSKRRNIAFNRIEKNELGRYN